ncbi:MAG TPA: hypothetical protein VHZ97_22370 [Pseudonocardiaceae bacterium]|jgi:hypothetical protein|nr:hypothetical protein [Pseudonocardiaceae bacterium]
MTNRFVRWGTLAVATALTSAFLAIPASATAAAPLTFGIYPGGYAGGGSTDGKPDDPVRIRAAIATLQGDASQFLIRDYVDCTTPFPDPEMTDLGPGRRLDLVITYNGESPTDWRNCVRRDVLRYGPVTVTISVTLEANIEQTPDPDTISALVNGVIAAKQRAREVGYDWLGIGFDEVAFGYFASTAFWQALASTGGAGFTHAVDYVGIDTYPDVPFPGVPASGPIDLTAFIGKVLDVVRNQEMPIAGLDPSVPIRVSENGWATSATRTAAQQQQALSTEINAVNADRGRYNVASYELFALRDDVTDSTNIFDQFGIMTDAYTPKPMFWTYRDLVDTLSHR